MKYSMYGTPGGTLVEKTICCSSSECGGNLGRGRVLLHFCFVIFSQCLFMKIAIFGHSYVRDLELLGHSDFVISEVPVSFQYFAFPGAGFRKFLNNPRLLDEVVLEKPDILVIILGGNDIKVNVELKEIKENCKEFFRLFRSKLPDSFFVATQVEFRHSEKVNRHGSPSEKLFRKLALHFNNWLNRQKFKDKIFVVNGNTKLCDVGLFQKDGVHLNLEGLEVYFDLLISALSGPVESLKQKNGL